VNLRTFSDACLVLVGHGTTLDPESCAPVYQHAAELRSRNLFVEVREGFWKQEPRLAAVLENTTRRRVFVVPFFMGEGYFSENVIPAELGFPRTNQGLDRLLRKGSQVLVYCKPVGTHPAVSKVVLARARNTLAQFPFPSLPRPVDTTLLIAGHGTERNEDSRRSVDQQVEYLHETAGYASVQAVFMEQEPRIADWPRLASTRNIIVVPFFTSDGLHTRQDIPVLLGESASVVRERLQAKRPPWCNPTEKHGKLVWYTQSVGTDPFMADVILERVREAQSWG
jgi:sirohydrochlorin cobaltochelatase